MPRKRRQLRSTHRPGSKAQRIASRMETAVQDLKSGPTFFAHMLTQELGQRVHKQEVSRYLHNRNITRKGQSIVPGLSLLPERRVYLTQARYLFWHPSVVTRMVNFLFHFLHVRWFSWMKRNSRPGISSHAVDHMVMRRLVNVWQCGTVFPSMSLYIYLSSIDKFIYVTVPRYLPRTIIPDN